MIDVKELIAVRQRRDPSFRAVKDAHTRQYLVPNQVVFQYSGNKTTDEAARLAQGYIDQINQQRLAIGLAALNLKISALSASIVVVSGQSVAELLTVSGGTTPPPKPPPPPWRPDTIQLNSILVINVLVDINQGRFDVMTLSQALAANINVAMPSNSLAANISVETPSNP